MAVLALSLLLALAEGSGFSECAAGSTAAHCQDFLSSQEDDGNALIQQKSAAVVSTHSSFGPFTPSPPAPSPSASSSSPSSSTTAVCNTFITNMLSSFASSNMDLTDFLSPTTVMSALTEQMNSGAMDAETAMTCLQELMNYGNQNAIPDECMLSNGMADPACCMYVKRCSSTNPADSCPTTIFGGLFTATGVTCVGSQVLSPVAMGVCKCNTGVCMTTSPSQTTTDGQMMYCSSS
mmetsp:Transcript_96374/g.171292  ORF Transcript_96374/g.171292 Transcript_96374/m.171292 type:complete len:236 (-) Transcript_96374:143-850(-)